MYKKIDLAKCHQFVFLEEKNKKNVPAATRGPITSRKKKRDKNILKNKKPVCYERSTGLLPLLAKRILIKLLVVGFVTRIVSGMVPALQRLLSDGLRAPVLIIGLAPLGLWLVVPVSFALSSYISTAATPSTTYPSSPSGRQASSGAAPAAPRSGPAPLGEAGPPSGRPSASSGRRRGCAPGAPAAAPPAQGLEVIVAVVGVVVAAAVVVVIVAVVVVVVLVAAVVVGGVRGVAAPVAASAPASAWRRHVGGRGVVVIVVVPGEEQEGATLKPFNAAFIRLKTVLELYDHFIISHNSQHVLSRGISLFNMQFPRVCNTHVSQ